MFNKIANILSIVSFVMVTSMSAGAFLTYRFVTSEQFKAKIMNEILGNVQGMMPKVLDQCLPKATGPSMPIINYDYQYFLYHDVDRYSQEHQYLVVL